MIWFPLLVLTFLIGFFGWLTDTVYPDMWAVGEQFGHPPERGEVIAWKMTKAATHFVAAMWWIFLFAAVFG